MRPPAAKPRPLGLGRTLKTGGLERERKVAKQLAKLRKSVWLGKLPKT